ncbi:MAG: hypothetical protein JWR36_949 [Glaciihabitans sp.]|nr:hypothetical protein [Glaciihabitans sp.]
MTLRSDGAFHFDATVAHRNFRPVPQSPRVVHGPTTEGGAKQGKPRRVRVWYVLRGLRALIDAGVERALDAGDIRYRDSSAISPCAPVEGE